MANHPSRSTIAGPMLIGAALEAAYEHDGDEKQTGVVWRLVDVPLPHGKAVYQTRDEAIAVLRRVMSANWPGNPRSEPFAEIPR
jgi:hypothetical protein